MNMKVQKFIRRQQVSRNWSQENQKDKFRDSLNQNKSKITNFIHGSAQKSRKQNKQRSQKSNESNKNSESKKSNKDIRNERYIEKSSQQIVINKSELTSFTKNFAQQKVHYEDKIKSLQNICDGLERQICRLQSANMQLQDKYSNLTGENKLITQRLQGNRKQHQKIMECMRRREKKQDQVYNQEKCREFGRKFLTQGCQRDSLQSKQKIFNKQDESEMHKNMSRFMDLHEDNVVRLQNQSKFIDNSRNSDLWIKNIPKNTLLNEGSNKGKSIIIRRKQSKNRSQQQTLDQTQNRHLPKMEYQTFMQTLRKSNTQLKEQVYILEGKCKMLTIDNEHMKRQLKLYEQKDVNISIDNGQTYQNNNQLKKKDRTINQLIQKLNRVSQQLTSSKSYNNPIKSQAMEMMVDKCIKLQQHIERLSGHILVIEKQRDYYRNASISTPHFNTNKNLKNIFNKQTNNKIIPQKLKCLIDRSKQAQNQTFSNDNLAIHSSDGHGILSCEQQDESFVVEKGHQTLLTS